MKTLRERVQECERRRPDISRSEIARAAGVKPPSVTDWFNGKTTRLKLAPAVGAARLWGCDPAWLGEGIGLPGWIEASPSAREPEPAYAVLDVAEHLTSAVSAMSAARWVSVRAQLDTLAAQPDKRADVLAELRALLSAALPTKRTGTHG